MEPHLEARNPDIKCKLIIIGDSDVGKTSIIQRFTKDEFSYNFTQTIGVDYSMRLLEIRNQLVKAQIWDTAGQEKYHSITTSYYRGANGIVIAYDVTNRTSFENVSFWVASHNKIAGAKAVGIVIGNKCDKKQMRVVSTEEGKKLAHKHKLLFEETSAKDNVNVDEAIMKVLDKIVAEKIKHDEAYDHDDIVLCLSKNPPKKPKSKCC